MYQTLKLIAFLEAYKSYCSETPQMSFKDLSRCIDTLDMNRIAFFPKDGGMLMKKVWKSRGIYHYP